ncbi:MULTISPECIES: hypothetical protein [unclassified Sphingopyxis]|jgi:hypothetical protein|uniref:hypothetical protein n=1 Tax=unclassified Sphingopyxis TaxID=2614943 RepID=UPI0025EF8626|nr:MULTISPECIES: hypothetical protein [unclassified Sphingopyxis]
MLSYRINIAIQHKQIGYAPHRRMQMKSAGAASMSIAFALLRPGLKFGEEIEPVATEKLGNERHRPVGAECVVLELAAERSVLHHQVLTIIAGLSQANETPARASLQRSRTPSVRLPTGSASHRFGPTAAI